MRKKGRGEGSPVTVGGHNIVDSELLADLFNTQVKCVCLELF
jgi:hypothetical protein